MARPLLRLPGRMGTADFQANLWTATAPPAAPTPPLQGERKVDVAVVGAGYTGLSTALHLAEAGASVAVLEAGEPGFGASGRNNGQVIPTYSRANPDDVVAQFGAEVGERMNAWVAGSADLVFGLIDRHDIDCDAERQGWLQPAHRPGRLAGARKKYEQWAARGAPVELLEGAATAELTGSPYYAHGGWLHRGGGHIQPLAYARGLARAALAAGAAVHGQSPVQALERDGSHWRLRTPQGALLADKAVLATNAYGIGLWPRLRQSVVPLRSFHAATAPLGDNAAASVLPRGHGLSDTRQALWAFRKDRHGRLVTTAAPLMTAGARATVTDATIRRLQQVFPQVERPEPAFIWEGLIAMTPERLPRFHELAGGLYAGLGYSGRGIAMATAMGQLLAQRCLGTPAAELPLPPAPLKPLPLHRLVVPLSRAMVLYYRWQDSRG